MVRLTIVIGAIYGALGVGLGAYQAHGLETSLAAAGVPAKERSRRIENARVAVHYQLVHALALVSVGSLSTRSSSPCSVIAAVLFAAGTLLFSGGLAAQALSGRIGHPAIIPGGGLLLILAWIALALHAGCCWRVQKESIPASL